ncbi:hypothetical protein QR680_009967 [Steinernema hermaphroditum]|uniref:DMAP1-binding domain-containing protein n=1 Tax=Steinernema hermaphroditum TaxID=289476 RepID=A0AA39INX5_9BILA|nr:hypothetical protein QR680_009967 [Steinernema hermaphroditum]
MEALDTSKLPAEIRERLAVLDLELSEGDITQKGYDKKKNLLLVPYLQAQLNGGTKPAASPQTRARRRNQRRLTKDESRFHSEIRAEAVQQALSQWKQEDKNILQPIKRGATQRRTTSSDQQPAAQLQRRRRTASGLLWNYYQLAVGVHSIHDNYRNLSVKSACVTSIIRNPRMTLLVQRAVK